MTLTIEQEGFVTVHASGIKKLTFEWAPVAGASRYDLWFKANDNAAWTRYLQAPAPRSDGLSNPAAPCGFTDAP